MTNEKFKKISELVNELHEELKPENNGPIEEYISLETMGRQDAWYRLFLSLQNAITMEL